MKRSKYDIQLTGQKRMENETRMLREFNEEIKRMNETLTQRLISKIAQIDNVSKIRERLRSSPDVSTGLGLILDSALNDLSLDVGAVLLIDRENSIVKLQGFKSRVEGIKVGEDYPLDGGFVELETVMEKRSISRFIVESEPSILNTASIHCIPILFGKDTKGVLAFGSQKGSILDGSDLAVLGLYSELASTLFERQSLRVIPVQEKTKVSRRFKLESGCSYIFKGDVEKAFEVFVDYVLSGTKGLCVTREFPLKIRRKYGLEKTPIVWLTEEKIGDQLTVYSLQDLSIMINGFLEKAKRKVVVLLDGFEFLISNHGFENFLRFLGLARNRFERHNSILIAPIFEESLDSREIRLIEREIKPLMVEDIANMQIKKGIFRGRRASSKI